MAYGRQIPDSWLVEIKTRGETSSAFFPQGEPTINDSPLAAAWLWWHAVLQLDTDRDVAELLSADPADWGDYSAVRMDLHDHALAQFIEPAAERPGMIAYAKFVPDYGHCLRAYAPFAITEGRWLTLVEHDGLWYVLGISDISHRPEADRIIADESLV